MKRDLKIRTGHTIHTFCKSCHKKNKYALESLTQQFKSAWELSNHNVDKFLLLLRKGVYPYEYMRDHEKFKEIHLPSSVCFDSNLLLSKISQEDYDHAQKVKKNFSIKNMGEYHDLYVQSDTALLSHTFENFRKVCLKEYALDPIYFVSTPSLAFEAMLKNTKVKLEYCKDIDMILMIENGTKGGITQVIHKYGSANNKYLNDYDKNIESSYLSYLDANNLYGDEYHVEDTKTTIWKIQMGTHILTNLRFY